MISLAGLFTMQSCKKDTSVPPKVYGSFTDPVIVAPANEGYVSVPGTTIDLKWESTDSDGDPLLWDVYFGTSSNPPLVKSGNTSLTYTATVAKGKEYFWRVQTKDANGVITRSSTWSFKVIDPAADMTVDLSWTTDVKTVIGIDLAADKAVDMRLLIVKASDKSIVGEEDGATYESYADFNTLPDGDYLVAADIYSTINAGDFNKPININLNLTFSQAGIIDQSIPFPAVMTNANACSLYRTYLATVKKVGTAYTITKAVSYMTPLILTWNGTDADSPSQATTTADCAGKTMTGLGFGWMLDYWGEIIVSGGTLNYTSTATTITIPLQLYCSTTYKGAPQTPYYVQGTGTIDNSGAYPVWTIHYDFKQGTHWVAAEPAYGGWPTAYFEAIITTNPAGKGVILETGRNFTRPGK